MAGYLRVSAVFAAGALAVCVTGCGSSPGPATTGLTRLWSVTQAGGLSDVGIWVTGGMLVTGTDGGLTSRSLSTGRAEWSWSPPRPPSGDSTSVAMSPGTADGTGVVSYAYLGGSRTAHEVGIDLADGHGIWTSTVSRSVSNEPPGYLLGDGVLAEVGTNGNPDQTHVAATSLATGKPAWSTASDRALAGCDFNGLAISGDLVYSTASCAGSSASVLYGLAASTGAVKSKVTLDDRACTGALDAPTLWTASGYLLVGCSGQERPHQQLIVLHAGSSRQAVVTYSSEDSAFDYPVDSSDPAPFVFSGATIYAEASGAGYESAVDAISLTSGRQLWQRQPIGFVIGAGSGGVLLGDTTSASRLKDPQGALSLAALSARSGTISYGPGTTFDDASVSVNDYRIILSGRTLLALAMSSSASPAIIAYGTGAWTGSR